MYSRTSLIQSFTYYFLAATFTIVNIKIIQLSYDYFYGSYVRGKHDLSAPTFSTSPNCDHMKRCPAIRSHVNKKIREAHAIENSSCPPRQYSSARPAWERRRALSFLFRYQQISSRVVACRIHGHFRQPYCDKHLHLSVLQRVECNAVRSILHASMLLHSPLQTSNYDRLSTRVKYT